MGIGSGAFPQPLTSYNGQSLSGQGLAPIVASANLAAQGFAVFNTATPVTLLAAAAPNAGTYRVSIYMVVTTLFATNTTEVITINYTDDQGARTITASCVLAAGTNTAVSSVFRSSGAAVINYVPSVTGSAATAGAASFSVVLERLI